MDDDKVRDVLLEAGVRRGVMDFWMRRFTMRALAVFVLEARADYARLERDTLATLTTLGPCDDCTRCDKCEAVREQVRLIMLNALKRDDPTTED